MLYYDHGVPFGEIGEFSFVDVYKKYKEKGEDFLSFFDDRYIYGLDLKIAKMFDKAIKAGKTKAVVNSMRKIVLHEKVKPDFYNRYNSKHPKVLSPKELVKFEKKHWRDFYKPVKGLKKVPKPHPVADDYLVTYMSGKYKDKKLQNIPVELDTWCKTQPKRIDVPLYRGIVYTEEWFKNEVERLDDNNKILYLKTDGITSWSTDINVSNIFTTSAHGFHILLELVYDGEIFCDLRKRNPVQQEVLLYPGRYKAKIIKNFFRMVKKEVDIGEDSEEEEEGEDADGLDIEPTNAIITLF